MATKGQKFQKYSQEQRAKIIHQYLNGFSTTYLSKKYNISKETIKI